MASRWGGSAADQAAEDVDIEWPAAGDSKEKKVSWGKKGKSATTLLKFVKGKWKSEDVVEDNEKRLMHDDDDASVLETVLKENSELQKKNTRLLKKLCDYEKTIKSYASQLQKNKEEIKRLKKISDKPRTAPVKGQVEYKVRPSHQRLADEKVALENEVGRLNQENSTLRKSLDQVTRDNSGYEARIKEIRKQAEQVEVKYQVEREEKERLNSEVKHLQEQFKSLLARDEKGEVQCSDDKIQSNIVIGRLQGRIKQLNEDLTSLREHSKTQSRQIIVLRLKAELTEHMEEQVASMDSLLIEAESEREDLRRKLIHLAATDDESDIAEKQRKHVQLDPKDADAVDLKKKNSQLRSDKIQLEEVLASKIKDIRALKLKVEKLECLIKEKQELQDQVEAVQLLIGDLEIQNSTLRTEVCNEKQNIRCEMERAERLKLSVNQLQIKTDCLERQLSDSNEKVKVLKDTATNMLMRCRSLLGQTEAECPLPETECDLSSELNIIMEKVEGQKCQNEKVKIQFKKAIWHLEEQLQWVNDEVIKFTSLMSKENDLLPFVSTGMNAPPNPTKNIGRGAFGSVDLVEINGIHCAAKTIYGALVGGPEQEYVSSSQRKPIQEKFQQECLLICKTRHQNIVQFMGVYCHDKTNGNIVLFMEYLPIDLHNCLERFQRNDIDIQTPMKLSILSDVCSGLLHIHNFSILHRDLTARNVLLTHHLNAKISDFGSSKRCNQSQKLTQAPGALPYMPPEAKSETPSYNTALDVFSFGVLTLFIAIQTFPELPMQFIDIPRDVRKRGEEELYVRRKWIARMSDGNPLHHIVLDCLQDSPSKRPFVRVLKTHLQELYKELSNETKDKAFEQMLLYISVVR